MIGGRVPGPWELGSRLSRQTPLPPAQRTNTSGEVRESAAPSRREVPKAASILDEDWEGAYANSDTWSPIMEQIEQSTHEDTDTQGWPEGFHLVSGKLYKGGELCVPEEYVRDIIRAYQFRNGNIGVEKLLQGIKLRYELPDPTGETLRNIAQRIKQGCAVCQACDPPNWAGKGKYEMTPIPEAPLISVCVDIFSLPEVEWEDNIYDSAFLCVDRHSGFLIA